MQEEKKLHEIFVITFEILWIEHEFARKYMITRNFPQE